MPTMNNYLNFTYVNLGFLAQIIAMMYFKSVLEIKQNWPLYRCNPPYWIFSDNISEDFTYCVQNTQMNTMGYILQPFNYMISSLTSVGGGLSESINNIRILFNSIRNFVSDIIQNVFGVFLNMIIEFQKIIISIKDMIGKMIGIVVTIMFILDGSIKTMNSAWKGPPGQLVKAIGSCFHPQTLVTLANGNVCEMQHVSPGELLHDGSLVLAVMNIHNKHKEPLYQIYNTYTQQPLYVTGEHYVFDHINNIWIQVKNYNKAIIQPNMIFNSYTCLITNTHHISLGSVLFWDWEDDCFNNI